MADVDLHPAFQFQDIEASQANVIDLKASISQWRKTSYAGMINLGHELRAVKASIPGGGYLTFLDLVALSQPTAWRYSRLAELNVSDGLTAARINDLGGVNATLKSFTVNDDDDLDDLDDDDDRVFTVNDDDPDDPEPATLPEPAPGPAVRLPDASAGAVERGLADVPQRMTTPVVKPPSKDKARIDLLLIEASEKDAEIGRLRRLVAVYEAEAGDALQPKLAVLQEREATNQAQMASIGEWQVKYSDLKRENFGLRKALKEKDALLAKLNGKG